MKLQQKLLILFLTLIIVITSCKCDKPISFESLLLEMVDREQLSYYPDPFYITKQFSSHDRESVATDKPGWFANWDRSMFIREEENQDRKEYVMMDAEGPGAIVRFWMTFGGEGAGKGILRIYFDHKKEPTIEGVAIDVLSGGQLIDGPLACSVSQDTEYEKRGHNFYLPLPYAAHVKVTYESNHIIDQGGKTGGESVYYNINYRTYNEHTSVETFTMEILEKSRATLDRVTEMLKKREPESCKDKVATTEIIIGGTIEPGEKMEQKISGSKALREILLQLDADDLNQALRSTIMEIEFDGNRTVWCPVGDFFGTGYQIRKVDTWYTHVSEEGLMCSKWIMPFKNEAVFIIHNLGEQPVKIIEGKLTVSDWNWNRMSMHFGATWSQYTELYTGERKTMNGGGNPFDLNYTHLKGEGVIVGDGLTLFNTSYVWWGEGDEKIFIDGEDFPSHFGTGTEDYYGYAWCRSEVFNEPFIAQPDGSGNFWPGYTVNLRYRSLDALPFKSEIQFDMEMWHWVSTWINFAPTTFFYLKPGGKILLNPDIDGAQEKVALKRQDIISPWIEGNAIEGMNLIEISTQGGRISRQWSQYGWSSGHHLWWGEADPGDELHLGFKSKEAGEKSIVAGLTIAPSYGVVEISINDSPPFRLDAYNADGVEVKEVNMGKYILKEGLNDIKIKLVATGPGQEKGMFRLDRLSFN